MARVPADIAKRRVLAFSRGPWAQYWNLGLLLYAASVI